MDVTQLNRALGQVSTNSPNVNESGESIQDYASERCLGFVLGKDCFAVPILRVEEIRKWEIPSALPGTQNYVKGVINLRGEIVPVVDLRELFLDEPQTYIKTTVIIMLRIFYQNSEDKIVGIVVDSLTDVIQYNSVDIKQAPNFNNSLADDYVTGLLSIGDNVYFLLNIDDLLNVEQF